MDQIDPDETQWRPFDKTCEPPQFFRKLRHGETKDMNWIHNRTVLLIGDTIEREHVEQFCKLMGRSAETVTEGNQWSGPPSSFDRYSGRSGKFGRGRNSRKGAKEGSLPRVCYIPEYNFVVGDLGLLVQKHLAYPFCSSQASTTLASTKTTFGHSQKSTLRQASSSKDSAKTSSPSSKSLCAREAAGWTFSNCHRALGISCDGLNKMPNLARALWSR